MAVNVLVGVGGTGAKIVEAALFLIAAGVCGPEPIDVGLVDQDNNNGNTARTRQLLDSVRTLRRDFEPPSGNRLDWTSALDKGGTAFLSTPVRPLFGDTAHWRPANADAGDLSQILRADTMGADERALFDLLFRGEGAASADAEQTMDLSEGYRGRAHVGAAALLAALHYDSPAFHDRMADLMRASMKGDEVRIVLVGSIFGGTGAAGFPTIARTLDALRRGGREHGIDPAKVHLGGVLMLPYFGFRDPASTQANVVRAADLLPQSRVALAYYERLFEQERVFDRLYVAGWNRLSDLAYHQSGRDGQRNPALAPELIGALGAMDFLNAPTITPARAPFVSARREADTVDWDDLPGSAAMKARLYDRMGRLLRFAVYWRYRTETAFDNPGGLFGGGKVKAGNVKLPWLKRLADGIDWQQGTPEARTHLADFLRRLLEWAAQMQLFADGAVGKFGLWDATRLLARVERDKPIDPIDLADARSEGETVADYMAILAPSDPANPPRDAATLFADRDAAPRIGDSAGLGRVISAMHHAARPFARAD